jgi:hypothetical protein
LVETTLGPDPRPVNHPVESRGRRDVEKTDQTAPARDSRHEALAVLIGSWINEGHTIGTAEISSVPILTSDVYEWAPGGFFVVHSAA